MTHLLCDSEKIVKALLTLAVEILPDTEQTVIRVQTLAQRLTSKHRAKQFLLQDIRRPF